ncbi:hypothetical protein [Agrobacterium tumefaciens]|uniref:Uncharacterized protein n=1 Tax=Agrobacterium tumefaciens TaxID=358 RepID=A0A176XBY9_AGRTU|nr:hypothetical protein [Agrobacterium tumefaciens]OAE46830.1 hypothetical protein A7J57_12145 [Agrobacterium tumefaciens]
MTYQSTRFPEVIVFKIKGLRATPVFKVIVDTVLDDTSRWIGPSTCVPVFRMEVVRPGETTDLPWTDRLIPCDDHAIERLLLACDEIESIQHKRNFLPDEKPKPRAKKKPEPKGPFSKRGYNLDNWSEHWHPYFDRPELTAEGAELGRLLEGYPFADRSPRDNARYIEMEIIHRIRDRFPTIYEVEKLTKNKLVQALTLISTPEIQRHGRPEDFCIHQAFHENKIPNQIDTYLSGLQGLAWMIRTGRIKDRDRKVVDPTDDEASEDKLFHIHGVGRGVTSDRAYLDDLADEEEMAAADAEEGIY